MLQILPAQDVDRQLNDPASAHGDNADIRIAKHIVPLEVRARLGCPSQRLGDDPVRILDLLQIVVDWERLCQSCTRRSADDEGKCGDNEWNHFFHRASPFLMRCFTHYVRQMYVFSSVRV